MDDKTMPGQKRIVLLLIILFGAGLFSVKAAKLKPITDEQPAVVKAVAPTNYPPIAFAARVDGKVVVEVKIDSAGKVVSADAVEGHALLKKFAADTAKRWQFEPAANGTKQRRVNLTFIFHIAAKNQQEEVMFSPPYQVEVTCQSHFIETRSY
jgi:TonB family protein